MSQNLEWSSSCYFPIESYFLDLQTCFNCGWQLRIKQDQSMITENFPLKSLAKRLPSENLSWVSMRYKISIWLLVEEKRLRNFVEWWVLSGHMTQIILTSSLQTIWWKYWPSTCASGEILFVFLEIFNKQDTIMNYYSTTKVSRKYTLHIICIANLLLILRSTSYGNLKKIGYSLCPDFFRITGSIKSSKLSLDNMSCFHYFCQLWRAFLAPSPRCRQVTNQLKIV